MACSAFITTRNPHSERLDDAHNASRQAVLLAALARENGRCVAGVGQHPSNHWPGKASVLVPGISRALATAPGRRFAQNAVLWAGEDAVPRLILLR